MPYILQRVEDGHYVTRPGTAHSYSPSIDDARLFSSPEAAEHDRCTNERRLYYVPAIGGQAAYYRLA